MSKLLDTFRYQLSAADTLQRLLIVNIAVFVVVRLVNSLSTLFMVPLFEFRDVSTWLAVPAAPAVLITKPWTLITYMFYHWDFTHILFNMLWLYWMGMIFQEYLGNKKLVSTYLLGGISGAVLYMLAYNIFPLFSDHLEESYAMGASASVLAITVAAATLVPDYPVHLLFFGRIPLKWIAAVTIVLDLISISGNNAGGHIAHLGGALFGFFYIRQLRAGRDIAAWLNNGLDRLFGGKKGRMKVRRNPRRVEDEEYNTSRKAKQERLDEILDKISKSGYGSLTNEEKEFLFTASKDDR